MANALDGTSTVCIVWKVPTQEGVKALRDFFEFHYTYMKEKKLSTRLPRTNSIYNFRKP